MLVSRVICQTNWNTRFMLYFSPLSVTDDKQRDHKHPFSFPQCRQDNGTIQYVGGKGGVSRSSSGAVIGDLVDADAWGIIPV